MNWYDNSTVVVTGAGGIGTAITLRFLEHGANVIVLTRTEESMNKLWETAVDQCTQSSLKLRVIRRDITDRNHLETDIDEIIATYKKIDILVNNAGVMQESLLVRTSDNQINDFININLTSLIFMTKFVAKQMMRQRSGRIINVSSISGLRGYIGQAVYAATKAGIIGFTRSMAVELMHYGIKVNAIAPGLIDTPPIQNIQKRFEGTVADSDWKETIPMGRLGKPEEVAAMVDYLCSPDADFITGQTFVIDGGTSL
jgi:3-oxoacyl-[acyl-carrier protein] reductase